MTFGIILILYLILTKSMSMIRESLDDSNTQLTSLGTTRSSHAQVSLVSNLKEMLANRLRKNLDSRLLVMTNLPTYHSDGFWDDQDANLDIIKFCGFGKCPNRYGVINREQFCHALFSEGDMTVFMKTEVSQHSGKKSVKTSNV